MNSEERAVFRHVREALVEERERRDCFVRKYTDAKQLNFDLLMENARLRKALEFYADDKSYEYETLSVDIDGTEFCEEPSILLDAGQIAREALGIDD